MSAKYRVTLFQETQAILEVSTDEPPTRELLTELALQELDKSGGAEWDTTSAWTEWTAGSVET